MINTRISEVTDRRTGQLGMLAYDPPQVYAQDIKSLMNLALSAGFAINADRSQLFLNPPLFNNIRPPILPSTGIQLVRRKRLCVYDRRRQHQAPHRRGLEGNSPTLPRVHQEELLVQAAPPGVWFFAHSIGTKWLLIQRS